METDTKKPADEMLSEVKNLIEDIVEREGIELVDVVFRREPNGWVLRVFIDKPGGVSLDDCRFVSRQLSDILDVKDIIPHAYRLELTSPGVNRPLVKKSHFMGVIGGQVKIKTRSPIENRRNFKGTLIDYKEGSVCLEVDGKEHIIPHDNIEKANLEYEFKRPGRAD